MLLILFKDKVQAQIIVDPREVAQGMGKSRIININVGGAQCYVKYTATKTFPSIGSMWRIPERHNADQIFSGWGKWYLHVYNSATGEMSTTGPYKGEAAAPNDPTINISAGGWTNKDVSISMNDNGDNGSSSYDSDNNITTSYTAGVEGIEYRYLTDSFKVYEGGVINESNEGWKVFEAYVLDNVGNQSNVIRKEFGIDKTPPTIEGSDSYGWTKDDVNISLSANDTLSGMSSIKLYNSSNIEVASGTSSLNYKVTTEGNNVFKVIATDIAGNESEKFVNAKIDRTAPNGAVSFTYNNSTFDLGINVQNIVESQSGVRQVWAEYTSSNVPSRNYKEVLSVANQTIDGIKICYNSVFGDGKYNKVYDLNNDKKIDVLDLTLAENENVVTKSDLNDDGIVSNEDVNLINSCNGAAFGSSKYKSRYDFDCNGVIDTNDISVVSKNIGKKYSYSGGKNLIKILGDSVKATVTIKAIDNCGNERTLQRQTFLMNAKPLTEKLEIIKYDYKENDNNYWIKPNTEFQVNTNSYFPSKYGVYPTKTYAMFANEGIKNSESAVSYADLSNAYKSGTEFDKNFIQVNNGKYALKTQQAINNSLSNILKFTHSLKAKVDGSTYKLFSTGSYIDSGKEYIGGYIDSNKWLKVDGQAPICDGVSISKQQVNELDLLISNLRDVSGNNRDKLGSGVNLGSIYMEVQPIGYDGKTLGSIEDSKMYIDLNNNNYNLKIDWNSCKNKDWYGKFKIQVFVSDNVGNKACIFNQVLDRQALTIQGVITPNPSPQGKNTTITIKTEGSAKKIKAQFPDELVKLATPEDPLIIEKDIKVEPNHTEQLKARVPLETPITLDEAGNRLREPYKIYIEAMNGYGNKVSKYLDLDIQASILDNIKVRLRGTGYDKE